MAYVWLQFDAFKSGNRTVTTVTKVQEFFYCVEFDFFVQNKIFSFILTDFCSEWPRSAISPHLHKHT